MALAGSGAARSGVSWGGSGGSWAHGLALLSAGRVTACSAAAQGWDAGMVMAHPMHPRWLTNRAAERPLGAVLPGATRGCRVRHGVRQKALFSRPIMRKSPRKTGV